MNRNQPQDSILTSRRALLKAAGGCAMMTNTSLMATLLNLQATNSLMAAGPNPGGYKALVCLFLFGGSDSYNMLVPNGGDLNSGEYGDYYSIRGGYDDGVNNPGGLALEQSSLVPIAGPDSRAFGLHEGLAAEDGLDEASQTASTGVAGLYNSGKLAFAANVGSLVERTTLATYQARTGLPLGLFSHADLQRHWQTGFPQSRSQITGWGGRMADLLQATNSNEFVSMNISLGGMNLYQTGSNVVPYAIGTNGANKVDHYYPDINSTGNREYRMYTRMMDGMFPKATNVMDATYSDLLSRSFAKSARGSTDAAISFNDATSSIVLNTGFANETPSRQLEMVAKCIGARSQLSQTRQIFFVSMGGYDNHNNLITAHDSNMPKISRALKSFQNAMAELQVENDVTLFTASEFARTLGTNGQGSDHAWGGNQMMMGGAVDGGKVFGDYPTELTPTNPLNLGRGRLIPTMSVDEFAAELAMWFGISNGPDLETIIPNIRRFYAASETSSPLGVLS